MAQSTRAAGFCVAGIYREKASGARADHAELRRLIGDLQPGDVIVAEKIERISRLPLPEAECLVASIRANGAHLCVPGLVELTEFTTTPDAAAQIVWQSRQDLLLKLVLQLARDDDETRRDRQRAGVQLAKVARKYPGRIPDTATHERIVALRRTGLTIKRTAELAGCSASQVKRIWALQLQQAST